MEFLASDLAQSMYAEQNHEYPVNPEVLASGLVRSWGEFEVDALPLSDIVKHRVTASKMVDPCGSLQLVNRTLATDGFCSVSWLQP